MELPTPDLPDLDRMALLVVDVQQGFDDAEYWGHQVLFALDATHTFDRVSPDGLVVSADQLARVTATNLHGEFATVVATQQLLPRS